VTTNSGIYTIRMCNAIEVSFKSFFNGIFCLTDIENSTIFAFDAVNQVITVTCDRSACFELMFCNGTLDESRLV
jgi:predicted transcriptional regulator